MALAPGSQLGGYEIRRQLGAGGMGVVYLASDLKLGRQVAIKVLSGDFGADHARTRRFEQEARAASALNHPNVCIVHALGETAAGQPFIAMEYVEGHTLRHLLQAQPPTLRQALDIATQIAAGVGAAHALGIVHRDLKPENVIVRGDGLVKVLDFGLAKLASSSLSAEAPEATRTIVQTDAGVVMGTYTYMAPEQARGQDVDARADIWALGVVLYELVAGRPPFTGGTRSDVLAAVLEREPVPLDRVNPRLPHELQRLVAKALRKDRAQRYQTITDLRLDLEALGDELQNASTDTSATSPAALAPPATSSAAAPLRESSAEYLITGLGRHKLATAAAVIVLAAGAFGLMRWGARQGAGAGTAAVTAAKPSIPRALDAHHVRRRPADRRDVLARRALDRVRLRSRRPLQHLGAVGRRRRSRAGDEIRRLRHPARLVARRQHHRVPIRARRRRHLPGAGARRRRAQAHLVWRASEVARRRHVESRSSPAPASTRAKVPCGCSRRRSTDAARRRSLRPRF